jgi:hypothetical protein
VTNGLAASKAFAFQARAKDCKQPPAEKAVAVGFLDLRKSFRKRRLVGEAKALNHRRRQALTTYKMEVNPL